MTEFGSDLHFPRLSGSGFWKQLQTIYQQDVEGLKELPFQIQQSNFHSAGARVSEQALREWRTDLNKWSADHGFPHEMNAKKKSLWDVELGIRLHADTKDLPEASHPHVWCWIAVNLLPHLVVHRWGWPAAKDDSEIPIGSAKWSRFGPDLKNGLRLATYRVATYGPELSLKASEQEFQSLQNRPSYGRDRRVARSILETLVKSYGNENSNYGKAGGTRALDCDDICQELQRINSMRPFCFRTDKEVEDIVTEVIDRLPEFRRPAKEMGDQEDQDQVNA